MNIIMDIVMYITVGLCIISFFLGVLAFGIDQFNSTYSLLISNILSNIIVNIVILFLKINHIIHINHNNTVIIRCLSILILSFIFYKIIKPYEEKKKKEEWEKWEKEGRFF